MSVDLRKEDERVPCHEVIEVEKQHTIYKNDKWWKAVVLGKNTKDGKRFVAAYLWRREEGVWKQLHKLKVNKQRDWDDIAPIMDEFAKEL